jgi:hypothetical protein
MTLLGRVEKGVVVFQNGAGAAPFPDGTLVEVTPVRHETGVPPAGPGTLAAPPVSRPDARELEKAVAAGLISKERQQALLDLIGMWKVEHPPDDEEVERIIDEYRMKKYG